MFAYLRNFTYLCTIVQYNTCLMNIDYISGFFDADGSITMSRAKSSDKFRTLKIDFTNTKLEILLEIQKFFYDNYGINLSISTKPAKKSTHSVSYSLSASSNINCYKLCELLKSYHPIKKHRINVVLKYHKQVTVRNGKYNEKQERRRLAYERLFFFSPMSGAVGS